MGDRANICIKQPDSSYVVLYTHWGGEELPLDLQRALRRRERWDDVQYLARIIFCAMIGQDVASETGYGITTRIHDNEHPLIVVDVERQRVSFVEGDDPTLYGTEAEIAAWTFEDFLRSERKHWPGYGGTD